MAELRRPVIWSSDARSDLSEIWNYYVKVAGQHTADRIDRRRITADTALRLSLYFGNSAEFWMNLQPTTT